MGTAGIESTANGIGTGEPSELSWYKDSDGTAATDLSVSQHTQWVRFPHGSTSALIAWGNTATGSPVGSREVQISNHGDSSVTTYDVYPGASLPSVAGAAGHINAKIRRLTNCFRLHYTATSGGTGAVNTDDTQQAGTSATAITY